jgi:hypothetical protein
VFFLSSPCVLYVQCSMCFWIGHSWLPLRVSLTFISFEIFIIGDPLNIRRLFSSVFQIYGLQFAICMVGVIYVVHSCVLCVLWPSFFQWVSLLVSYEFILYCSDIYCYTPSGAIWIYNVRHTFSDLYRFTFYFRQPFLCYFLTRSDLRCSNL